MAGLDILQEATSEPITLAAAKRQLRLDTSFTDDDDYIYGLIAAARELAEDHTARSFVPRQFREYFDGFPGTRLPIPYTAVMDFPLSHRYESRPHRRFELSRSPLVSIAQIQYLDQTGATQTLDPSVYYVSSHADPAHITRSGPGAQWPEVLQRADSVWVDFTAGYGVPVAVTVAANATAITGAKFAPTDAGKPIQIPGAGALGAPLLTTLASVDGQGAGTLAAAASTAVTAAEAWLGDALPPMLWAAMLLLIDHWYENRLPIMQAGQAEMPYGIRAQLDRRRVYYQP